MNRGLIRLAKISPKSYAAQILKRNKSLLEKLMLLKPYIGKKIEKIPDRLAKKVMQDTRLGCPHCDKCLTCLWTQVFKRRIQSCLDVPFNRVSYSSQEDHQAVSISYGRSCENINLWSSNDILSEKEWNRCRIFLETHIEWASLPCWGEKCVDGYEDEN